MGIIQSSVAEHASQSQWALMTGLGDQCDMTLVGGFSRQGVEISTVLLRVRGSGAAGSAEAG